MLIRRGDIFNEVDLTDAIGSEQGGVRPCIVVSNNICNKYSPVVTIIPISAQIEKLRLPVHVELDHEKYGFARPSFVMCEHILTVDKSRLSNKSNKWIYKEDMDRIELAMRIQLGLI